MTHLYSKKIWSFWRKPESKLKGAKWTPAFAGDPVSFKKRRWIPAVAGMTVIFAMCLASCRKDREPNKIIDGLPLRVEETVLPVHALQELMLLKRDNIRTIVTEINKTTIANTTFNELTLISSNTYQFGLSEGHYGNATITIQCFDGTGTAIDPFVSKSSTATLKTVSINTTGTSGLYTYTESGSITLDTAGDTASTFRSTGTYTFNGSGYALTFQLASPGSRTVLEGFRDGTLTATGTGPNAAVGLNLTISNDHSVDGSVTWEGQVGSLHLANNGTGFVVTSSGRIPIN